MISYVFSVLRKSALYVQQHPQILFVLILLLAFPFLFLYSGQQFLEVGRANQETLQQQRVGLMHDVFASLISATDFNAQVIQDEFQKVAKLNPDIINYKVSQAIEGDIVPAVAADPEAVGVKEEFIDLYRNASITLDESLIFESYTQGQRMWNAYRAVEGRDGSLYFIYTQTSQQAVDDLFSSREQSAYFSLVFVYAFLIALAYWHIRLTDYRYLYITAKKANETKDLFTNMIAHELRSPLTAIRGYASMLEEGVQDRAQLQFATRVRESSERLIVIVNDLLDVARIQSGKISIEREMVDVVPIIRSAINELHISAKEKKVEILFNQNDRSFVAYADKKRFAQAMTNLISNAIKYTPQGTIEITAEDSFAFVELRVKDTGMGIASEDQKKLFAPFFRVETDDVSKITGSGLGMWITKQLIELMDGTINVESIKGVGTHVVVRLQKKHSQ